MRENPTVEQSIQEPFRARVNWHLNMAPLGRVPASLLSMLLAGALAGILLWGFQTAATQVSFDGIATALGTIPSTGLLAAGAATLVSYAALFGYELLALRYAGARLPLMTILRASLCGYGIGNAVGLGLFTGGAVRYRIYTAAGLSAAQVARVILFISFGFGIGIATIVSLTLIFCAGELGGALDVSGGLLRSGAIALLALLTWFLIFCARRRGPLSWGTIELELPCRKLIPGQIGLAAVDILAAAVAAWMLLPDTQTSFLAFASIYGMALALGVISHIPGGLGVFELTMLLALDGKAAPSSLAAALIAYRTIYFLLPLLLATILLACFEIRLYFGSEFVQRISRGVSRLAPFSLAVMTFLAGSVLVVYASLPPFNDRLQSLEAYLPLWTIEASNVLAGIAGFILLIAARGLAQRLEGAWRLAFWTMLLGLPLSLIKGLTTLGLSIILVVLAVLGITRSQFRRRSPLLGQPLTTGWFMASAIVIGAMTWIWWGFGFGSSASAVVGVAIFALVIGVWQLFRPNAMRINPPDNAELDRARRIAVRQTRTDALLGLMGDKNFLFSKSGNSFLMFSKFGTTWAALGNPVGPESEWAELVWRFIELACSEGGRAAFYQVPAAALSFYLDAGLKVLAVGEEARISLQDFSLAGAKRTGLRYALRRGERDDLEFEIVPACRVAALIEHVESISNAWLSKRINAAEKHFSVAAFNRNYLLCQQLALVRRHGKPIAFASVMTTEIKEEATIGLMRYLPDEAPSCTMEYLLVQSLLHFKKEGYNTFSLGVAPLAGLNRHPLAGRLHGIGWLIASVARNFYNFNGIHTFKAKFNPAWEPRYLVASGAFGPYLALLNIGMSISSSGSRVSRSSKSPIKRWRLAPLGFCFAAAVAVVAPAYVQSGLGEPSGVHIFYPADARRGFVVLFSDAKGWTAASNNIAAAVSRTGAVVVGVDLKLYLKTLAQDPGRRCPLSVHDVEVISKRIQRTYGNTSYVTPIIAGIGEGGTLAETILAKAPPVTIAAAVSLDLAPLVQAGEPLCLAGSRHPGIKSRSGAWLVGFTPDADIQSQRQIEEMKGLGAPTKIVSFAETAPEAMASLVQSVLTTDTPNPLDLPLVELPASPPGPLLAIFLSGDGGWRDLDRTIGIKLQSLGVSVIGWDSLRYFWNRKTPEQTAHDLDTVIKVYSARYKASKVALIGYSFGADVLPFAYNRLSPEAKSRVVQLSLLSPATTAGFEISVGGWFGRQASENALPTEPALASITPAMIQCFYGGDNSKSSACHMLTSTSEAQVVRTDGGHHFDGDYDALARQIRERLEQLAGN